MSTIQEHKPLIAAGIGAGVAGAGTIAIASRAVNSDVGQSLLIAGGAGVGGKAKHVPRPVGQVIAAHAAHTGKLGEFARAHPGGVAHLGGKLTGGLDNGAITGAANAVGAISESPRTAALVGDAAVRLKEGAVGLVAADALGHAVPKVGRIAIPAVAGLVAGAAGAGIGYVAFND